MQVIQSDVFAFKINSQNKKLTEVDWRYGLTSDQFEFFQLPCDIENKLVEFLKCSGLFCGAFDLICDEGGDYWFLECNPEGQWEWLDEMIDNRISKSFAKNLIELRSR